MSDHTEGYIAPVVVVGLGASIIEKYFILNRNMVNVDASFSLESKEFALMVENVRLAWKSMG